MSTLNESETMPDPIFIAPPEGADAPETPPQPQDDLALMRDFAGQLRPGVDAERAYRRFMKGTLSHRDYKALSEPLQLLYKSLFGYRPASVAEKRQKARKEEARAKKRRAEKQGRKTSRRS